jgi:hypothetical protein
MMLVRVPSNLDGLFTTCGLGFEVAIFSRKTYALNCLLVQILSWGFFSLVKCYPTNIHGNPFLMLLNRGKHSQLTILQSIYMVTRSLYISTKNRVESCLNSYNNGRFNIKFYSSNGLYAFQFFLKDFSKN